jgi:deazaflavin-dependent oxidoreductase (nitroreductase family)
VFKAPVWLYRWRLGWLLGHRFLLLEHEGRRSGRRYETVLEVVKWGPMGEFVVMSGWGPEADWYRNVTTGGDIRVTVESHTFPAIHRVVSGDEAEQALADYEHRNRYVRPIVNGMLGYLVGWRYDGSPEARRRLAEQLPLIAFRTAQGVA